MDPSFYIQSTSYPYVCFYGQLITRSLAGNDHSIGFVPSHLKRSVVLLAISKVVLPLNTVFWIFGDITLNFGLQSMTENKLKIIKIIIRCLFLDCTWENITNKLIIPNVMQIQLFWSFILVLYQGNILFDCVVNPRANGNCGKCSVDWLCDSIGCSTN